MNDAVSWQSRLQKAFRIVKAVGRPSQVRADQLDGKVRIYVFDGRRIIPVVIMPDTKVIEPKDHPWPEEIRAAIAPIVMNDKEKPETFAETDEDFALGWSDI